jgi:FkbM family methyltransferase
MNQVITKIGKALLSRYSSMKTYKKISSNFLSTLVFISLPSKFSHWKTICRFRIGKIDFYSRRSDLVSVEEVAFRGEYDFIASMPVAPSATVLDLGANIGMFAIAIFQSFPDVRVFSFEASSDTFRVLQKNCHLNSHMKWHIFHQAIWNTNGIVRFDTKRESTTRRVITDTLAQNHENVQSITIDNAINRCKSKVTICKMDIEGAEEEVLLSSPEALKSIDNLIIEIHPDTCNKEHIVQILKAEFSYLYSVSGRNSNKPLVVATRAKVDWNFANHNQSTCIVPFQDS